MAMGYRYGWGLLRCLALCVAGWCALPAGAQIATVDLGEPIKGLSGITYLDAVRLVAPGAGQNGRSPWDDGKVAGQSPLRHISGDAADAQDAPAEIRQGVVSVQRAQSGGRQRLLLLLDLGTAPDTAEGYAVLALIDPGASPPKLLDAANVGYDRLTGFFTPGALRVGQGEDVALVSSSHFNSNQSYRTVAMIGLRGDKLRLIDTVLTLGDAACGYQRTQTPRFTAQGGAIRVKVTEAVRHTQPACKDQPRPAVRQRSVAVDYRWKPGAGAYGRSSDALERLAGEAVERF